jgi:S1-C subfamily serine protease
MRFIVVALVLAVACASGTPVARADAKQGNTESDLRAKLEAAQARLDEAAREVAELSMALSEEVGPFLRRFRWGRSPAVLGINIDACSDIDDGVKVMSVSPGGPAERAGLQAGDVLVSIDDVPLKGDDEHTPRAKLLRHLRNVEPGQRVKVQYRRGDKTASADIVTEALDRGGFPAFPGLPAPHMLCGPYAGAFGLAQLAPLTPQLGRYFGTEEGLLVVRAPKDGRLKLEDGDVILDIDGRKPQSPAHAFRILGSYQSGERVKINVLRMKKRVTLDVAVPESTGDVDARATGERERALHAERIPERSVEPPL